jgi:hypothetical protein
MQANLYWLKRFAASTDMKGNFRQGETMTKPDIRELHEFVVTHPRWIGSKTNCQILGHFLATHRLELNRVNLGRAYDAEMARLTLIWERKPSKWLN